jgi:hypothetical protein
LPDDPAGGLAIFIADLIGEFRAAPGECDCFVGEVRLGVEAANCALSDVLLCFLMITARDSSLLLLLDASLSSSWWKLRLVADGNTLPEDCDRSDRTEWVEGVRLP